MVTYINIDTILSDPLLLTATVLLIVGPILFLVSLWKLIRTPRKKDPLFDMSEVSQESFFQEEKPSPPAPPPPPAAPVVPKQTIREPAPEPASPEPASPPRHVSVAAEETVVMPPGVAEIQGQLEIAFSQIKHLNKKVYELETALGSTARQTPDPLEISELKEPPMNPADFTQKLLKLAEHVIVLEKNMARLISTAKTGPAQEADPMPKPPAAPPPAPPSKPPIMPL